MVIFVSVYDMLGVMLIVCVFVIFNNNIINDVVYFLNEKIEV